MILKSIWESFTSLCMEYTTSSSVRTLYLSEGMADKEVL